MTTDQFKSRRNYIQEEIGDGVAIIFNAQEVTRNNDCNFKFRSDSYFHYTSNFPEPCSVLFIVGGETPKSILFCRTKNVELETWEGFMYGPDFAKEKFGFDEAYSIDQIDELAPNIIAKFKKVYTTLSINQNSNKKIQSWIKINKKQKRSGIRSPEMIVDLSHLLDSMRVVKSKEEISLMKKSADIAAKAHLLAMQKTRPGLYEYQIEGEILNQFMQLGGKDPAYHSIVAGGINACTLHYTANSDQLKNGDLLLIDAGCEFNLYASDITRTYPINGKFSEQQKLIYTLVLDAQKAAIAKVIPGNSFDMPHKAALNILAQGLIDLDFCQGSLEQVIEEKQYQEFFMHRTSHWLGLDVHDVGDYVNENDQPIALACGNVLTIEPGLYISPSKSVPKEFWGIGIRIEDDVAVTRDGNNVLSSDAPKEISDLESLVGSSIEK